MPEMRRWCRHCRLARVRRRRLCIVIAWQWIELVWLGLLTPSTSATLLPSSGRGLGITDRRGSYDRSSSSKKRCHAQIAFEHQQSVYGDGGFACDVAGRSNPRTYAFLDSLFPPTWLVPCLHFAVANPCRAECPWDRKCGRQFTQQELIRAHEFSFGTDKKKRETEGTALQSQGLPADGHREKRVLGRWMRPRAKRQPHAGRSQGTRRWPRTTLPPSSNS